MVKAGITGGIGSGKSTVCRIFSLMGIPVFNADDAAKTLMETHSGLKAALTTLAGKDTYLPDGHLNRRYLAEAAFTNPLLLEEINALVHPYVHRAYSDWMKEGKDTPYTILEAAILLESGLATELDQLIVVDAPEALRIERVKERDKRTETEIRSIISRQWSSEKRNKHATYLIENDDRHLVIPQILKIDNTLQNISGQRTTSGNNQQRL